MPERIKPGSLEHRTKPVNPVVYHIPICPFCQRLEILLTLKGREGDVAFTIVDITKPRPEHILTLTGGTTALPVVDLGEGRSLKESLVIMGYFEDLYAETPLRRADPYERALENLLVTKAEPLVTAGYRLVMNQTLAERDQLVARYHEAFARIDDFLRQHGDMKSPWLFESFGWAEAIFTPFFQRFAMNVYYENVDIPATDAFDRVRAWRDACVGHEAAQQTSSEEIVKCYYDYACGFGNGALPPGRTRSSFSFTPHWRERPLPPPNKYDYQATDLELGLV